jgi:hypothetical protein
LSVPMISTTWRLFDRDAERKRVPRLLLAA